MTWQDIVVWVIGLGMAALLIRRLVCLLRGKTRGGCTSCTSNSCSLKSTKKSSGK